MITDRKADTPTLKQKWDKFTPTLKQKRGKFTYVLKQNYIFVLNNK